MKQTVHPAPVARSRSGRYDSIPMTDRASARRRNLARRYPGPDRDAIESAMPPPRPLPAGVEGHSGVEMGCPR